MIAEWEPIQMIEELLNDKAIVLLGFDFGRFEGFKFIRIENNISPNFSMFDFAGFHPSSESDFCDFQVFCGFFNRKGRLPDVIKNLIMSVKVFFKSKIRHCFFKGKI
jgi:hypothetical protein